MVPLTNTINEGAMYVSESALTCTKLSIPQGWQCGGGTIDRWGYITQPHGWVQIEDVRPLVHRTFPRIFHTFHALMKKFWGSKSGEFPGSQSKSLNGISYCEQN